MTFDRTQKAQAARSRDPTAHDHPSPEPYERIRREADAALLKRAIAVDGALGAGATIDVAGCIGGL